MSMRFYLSLSLLQKLPSLILSLCTFPLRLQFLGGCSIVKIKCYTETAWFPQEFFCGINLWFQRKQNKSNNTLTKHIDEGVDQAGQSSSYVNDSWENTALLNSSGQLPGASLKSE